MTMKKFLISISILFTFIISISAAYSLGKSDDKVIFKGWDYKYKNDILNIDGTLYVPLRETFEFLKTPVTWDEESRTATVDMNNKILDVEPEDSRKEGGVIPDEETAYNVGKLLLEKYVGRELEYETDIGVFYLKVTERPYTWLINQQCDFKIKGGGGGTGFYSPSIILDRNTGEVIKIYAGPHFAELTDWDEVNREWEDWKMRLGLELLDQGTVSVGAQGNGSLVN